MWPLCLIIDKMIEIAGGDRDDDDDSAASISHHSHFVDVPHVQQMFSWDCGLACVSMVLMTLSVGDYDIQQLAELCNTTSIWTVDLAYLLHKFSVNFSFFTVTLGANPNYSAETFYREQLQDDVERVERLFNKALDTGICIQCRSISVQEICTLILSGQYIAVALVDKIKLSPSWLKDVCIPVYYYESSNYMGHYVVICGYDADTKEFEIRDPASTRKYVRVSLESLDEARKSFGTDEDILLVSLNLSNGGKLASDS
uniref:Guanylyl cyclase n=1 Tax=Hippeastrum hybrid cultivar TaxID=679627 RepID=D9MWM6_9ASPA|nr:guanylyl cyclase [Hippeastrum hybrid cultivar]